MQDEGVEHEHCKVVLQFACRMSTQNSSCVFVAMNLPKVCNDRVTLRNSQNLKLNQSLLHIQVIGHPSLTVTIEVQTNELN